MGRGAANRVSPYSRAPIAFSGDRNTYNNVYSHYSAGVSTGIYGVMDLLSLSATTTILSLQGPGVMGYLEYTTNNISMEVIVKIDDVAVISATYTAFGGVSSGVLIGWRNGGDTTSAICWLDSIPFEKNFTFTLRAPTSAYIKTSSAWRLTSG